MSIKLSASKLVALILVASCSMAGRVIRSNYQFNEKTFDSNDRSHLKRFSLSSYDYKAEFSKQDFSLGSVMHADYFTSNIEQLTEFGVVQFIRGCRFSSKKVGTKVTKWTSSAREFFGEVVPFRHPSWVIDSVDLDPMYNSSDQGRHAFYRWNESSAYDKATEHYFFQRRPLSPRLYVRDMPGTAFYADGVATNISLKFKSCIFRIEDIPLISAPDTELEKLAISCLKWQSSFIYDFELNKYKSPLELDSFCLE